MEISAEQLDKWMDQARDAEVALPRDVEDMVQCGGQMVNCSRTFLQQLRAELRDAYLRALAEEANK